MNRACKEFIRNFGLCALAGVCRDVGPKVLVYHDVFGAERYTDMGTPLAAFKRHFEMACESQFCFVQGVPHENRQLMVCFDDGFRGIWDTQDFFVENKLYPTIFIAVELVGTEGYLTWPEILSLQERGFVFESHAWSHRTLTKLPIEQLAHELLDSRMALSEKLGKDVRQICFPQGGFSRSVYDESVKAGYEIMFSSVPGNADKPLGGLKGVVRRNLVQFADKRAFKAVLNGGLNLFDRHYFKLHYKQ